MAEEMPGSETSRLYSPWKMTDREKAPAIPGRERSLTLLTMTRPKARASMLMMCMTVFCFGAMAASQHKNWEEIVDAIDVVLDVSQEVMAAAYNHKGCSVVEILQNCMIFNNGIHNRVSDRATRAERTIHLVHGQKMLFGKDNELGLVQDGFGLKAVTIGEDGYTLDDVLVHDAHCQSNFLHQQLAMMDGDTLPLAIGVIRDVEAPTYETDVAAHCVTIRERDSMQQVRIPISEVKDYIAERVKF